MSDVISVTELHLRSSRLEPDLWQRPLKLQPLVVSLQVYTNIDDEALCDNLLAESLNYGYITKQLELCFDQLEQEDSGSGELALEVVAELLAHVVLFKCHAPNVSLQVERPRALLTATAVGLSVTRSKSDYHLLTDEPHHHPLDLSRAARNLAADTFYVRQLKRQIIIGLNPGERIDQQEVIVDLEFKHDPIINNDDDDDEHERKMPYLLPREMVRPGWRGWRGAVKRVEQHLSTSAPLTIENLVVALSSLLLTPHPGALSPPLGANTQSELAPTWSIPETTVRVSKPSALMFAKYPAVQVTRTRKHFPQLFGAGTAAGSTAAAVPAQQFQQQQQRRDLSSSASLPRPTTTKTTPDSAFRAQLTDQAPFSTSTSTRTHEQQPQQQQQQQEVRTAFIGLGTNLGCRPGNLNDAVTLLDEALLKNDPVAGAGGGGGGGGGGRVVETSWMYESEAMYHEEQDKFLNAAIKIETSLEPVRLLAVLKDIESRLGRDFTTFRNGPRVIDLDLLLYDQVIFDSRRHEHEQEGAEDAKEKTRWWLKVPHASIGEREFVLKPLVDIAPDFVHPVYGKSISALLQDLAGSPSFRSTVHRVFPLSRSRVHPYSRAGASRELVDGKAFNVRRPAAGTDNQTLIMSILNMTPDSFSDGKSERLSDVQIALREVEAHLEAGADIVDVGGMSTRPEADDVQPGDEVERVVPVIRAIRARSEQRRDGDSKANGTASATTQEKVPVVISIDTFRPDVARAAIKVGADIINDVYGGREPGMLEAMADLACPVVLMHSRGNPSTMTSLTDYSVDGGLVPGIRREMEEMVRRAGEAGVRRWNVILDPGFGFAKTGSQNLVLLRSLDQLFRASPTLSEYPVLIGLSRKKFLAPEKKVARERRIETVAGVACAAQSGRCEIARVHDTTDARDALAFTDRLLASRES